MTQETFPLAAASAFFLNLKLASNYAPPDVTGELEGQFLAPKAQVVDAIVQLIQNELKTGFAYQFYANTLRDLSRNGIAEEFLDHASEETEHADWLMQRLAVLAGTAQIPDVPAPPPVTDPLHIIQTMIRIEQEGIAKWRLLRSLIGDENPMRFKVEEYLTREQHHLDELWQLLPHTPDAGEKKATALPTATSDLLVQMGRAGQLAPHLQKEFSRNLMNHQIGGAVAGGLIGGGVGALSADPEKGESRLTRGLIGATAGAGLGGLAGRYGTRRIPGLNKELPIAQESGSLSPLLNNTPEGMELRDELLKKLHSGSEKMLKDDTPHTHVLTYGSLGKPTEADLVHPVRTIQGEKGSYTLPEHPAYPGAVSPSAASGPAVPPPDGVAPSTLNAVGGFNNPLLKFKYDGEYNPQLAFKFAAAPPESVQDAADGLALSMMLRDTSLGLGAGNILAAIQNNPDAKGYGRAKMYGKMSLARLGGAAAGIGLGSVRTRRMREKLERGELPEEMDGQKRILPRALMGAYGLAASPEGLFALGGDIGEQHFTDRIRRMVKGASPMGMDPTIPQTLTPSGTGSLSDMLTGVDQESQHGEGLPEIPQDVAPEEIDPSLLLQLQQEEKGRVQEADEAARYFQEQAQQTQQQMQMLQQQLEQQAQQAQTIQMQLQQEQAQKQQAQQMAQQSADTATAALQQQLQMQQMALQSRQMSTTVLQQHDGLKQQIRELIDPAPPPPTPPADPAAQAVGMTQPPQGGAPQGPAVPPPEGAPGAPKTAAKYNFKALSPEARDNLSAGLAGTTVAVKAISDGIRDYRQRGPGYAMVNTGIPALMTVGQVGFNLRPGREQRAQEHVQESAKALSRAEREYDSDRTYANAMRLVAAKTQAAAAELNQNHPGAAAAAQAAATYAAGKGLTSSGMKLKQFVEQMDRSINDPLLKRAPNNPKEI